MIAWRKRELYGASPIAEQSPFLGPLVNVICRTFVTFGSKFSRPILFTQGLRPGPMNQPLGIPRANSKAEMDAVALVSLPKYDASEGLWVWMPERGSTGKAHAMEPNDNPARDAKWGVGDDVKREHEEAAGWIVAVFV